MAARQDRGRESGVAVGGSDQRVAPPVGPLWVSGALFPIPRPDIDEPTGPVPVLGDPMPDGADAPGAAVCVVVGIAVDTGADAVLAVVVPVVVVVVAGSRCSL